MYFTLGIIFLIIFFILMLLCIVFGQRAAKLQQSKSGLTVTEGAVFTLMALLIAFTFGSANQRFDQRRALITEEANAISTAYLRLDMLNSNERKILHEDFYNYINSRLAIYKAIPDFAAVDRALENSQIVAKKLWLDTVSATKSSTLVTAPMLLLPAINTMLDLANTRTSFTYYHPPFIVFVLLVLIALLSAFLMGYGIANRHAWSSIHIVAYAFITTLTIYVIVDLEYPRLGFITEASFDQQLIKVQDVITSGRNKA